MILFGFGLVSYHKSKGDLYRYSLLNLLGDLTSFSIFALVLVLAKTPVFDPRTSECASSDSYDRLVFGLIVFSVFFGCAYGVARFRGKK